MSFCEVAKVLPVQGFNQPHGGPGKRNGCGWPQSDPYHVGSSPTHRAMGNFAQLLTFFYGDTNMTDNNSPTNPAETLEQTEERLIETINNELLAGEDPTAEQAAEVEAVAAVDPTFIDKGQAAYDAKVGDTADADVADDDDTDFPVL